MDSYNTFSPDELSYLALVEDRIRGVVRQHGLDVVEGLPSEVRGLRLWQRNIPMIFRGEDAYLSFEVAYTPKSEEPFYRVFAFGNFDVREGVGFYEIKPIDTKSLSESLESLEDRIVMVSEDKIPASLLPVEDIWIKSEACLIPEEFIGQVPLFQVIDGYKLRKKRESLEVTREFANCLESMRVHYEGPYSMEDVFIYDGKITRVMQNDSPVGRFNFAELFIDFAKFKTTYVVEDPGVRIITYHNIKRWESRFRGLPWQQDFRAVYEGSGVFENPD